MLMQRLILQILGALGALGWKLTFRVPEMLRCPLRCLLSLRSVTRQVPDFTLLKYTDPLKLITKPENEKAIPYI